MLSFLQEGIPTTACLGNECEVVETPNDSLASGIEAVERLLRIVDQRAVDQWASKFRNYTTLLTLLKSDLQRAMHDESGSANVTGSQLET